VGLLAACGDNLPPPPHELPAWERGLPPAFVMGVRRGLTPVRGIVHLHSPYSHDACDGSPRDPTGAVDEWCLEDLRAALCTTHIDFAALTDHPDSMADEEFPALFSMRGADQPILRGADAIASRMRCRDGHEVIITVGGEDELMPIMLDRHVPGTVAERRAIYSASDVAAATAFRDAGGLLWIAHPERRPLERLRELRPDGLEVFNLHASLDADAELEPFEESRPGSPQADLALLAFLQPDGPALDTWHALLSEGHHLAITGGTDAHQNALPRTLADGERGDSYRRMLRSLSNVALVEDPRDVDQLRAALAAGRTYAVFELLGTPEGFDAVARTPSGALVELGGTVPFAEGAVLSIELPRVRGLDPLLPAPTITGKVVWIKPGGAPVVISERTDRINVNLGAVGAYLIEVDIVPAHLGPYLGDLGTALAEQSRPWIYTSPIYVQ